MPILGKLCDDVAMCDKFAGRRRRRAAAETEAQQRIDTLRNSCGDVIFTFTAKKKKRIF